MSQRIVEIDGIGPVTIAKRRGTLNLRISINAKGRVRVGMPAWLPYKAGIEFARSHRAWVLKKIAERPVKSLKDGARIGKSHRLSYIHDENTAGVRSRLYSNLVEIRTDLDISDPIVQAKAATAAEKALKVEADMLLPQRLKQLATKHGYSYKDLRIRKLTSRWGSCSNQQIITLSFLLIQLPWHLIDYVLIHELVHTKHMNHGESFWTAFETALPGAKARRKEIRQLQPHIIIA